MLNILKIKKILRGICLILILVLFLNIGLSVDITNVYASDKKIEIENKNNNLFFYENSKFYVNLDKIIASQGYYLDDKTNDIIAYKKDKTDIQPEIIIKFDLKSEKADKNEFKFDIKNGVIIKNKEVYIYREYLKKILNVNITKTENNLTVSPIKFGGSGWIFMCDGLVAHAGGWVANSQKVGNCLEAVINSYNCGHRVFELDFNLTTDGKLAVVHDWVGYKGMKSSEEWEKIKIWDVFTSMMLEDVLDIMLVNKDMHVITDTKSFEYTTEQIAEQFKILVETAKKKDPSLEILSRIIPQIYNQPMYDIVMDQFDFQSVIYTLYKSPDKEDEVIEFIKKHSNIRVVTMAPPKNRPEFVKKIKQAGRYVYLHTINDPEEIKNYRKTGIWGFYTDNIYPPQK